MKLLKIIGDGLKTGLVLAATTNAAIMLASDRELGDPWAAINAVAHIVDGDTVTQPSEYSPRESVIGILVNGTAMAAWGVLYEGALAVTKTQSGPLTGALGAAAAYVIDYKIVPKQYTPGIEKKLSHQSVLAAYLVLGVTLALSGALEQGRRSVTKFRFVVLLVAALTTIHPSKAQGGQSKVSAAEYVLRGIKLADQGKLEAAIAEYQKAIAEQPHDPNAHEMLGVALMRSERDDEAIQEYHVALQLRPGDATCHTLLGMTLQQADRPDEAVPEFQAVAHLKPGDWWPHFELGQCYRDQRRFAPAAQEYRQAVTLRPDKAIAHLELGMALYWSGHQPEARQEWQKTAAMNDSKAATAAKKLLVIYP